MRVELSQHEGRQGDLVKVRVEPETTVEISGVHVSVDAYGVNITLHQEGDAWVGQESVPYEADPGVYDLTIRAYDNQWHTLESAQSQFTVRA